MICPRCGFPLTGLLQADVRSGLHPWCEDLGPALQAGGKANKIWCDYFHRGVEIVRVDDFRY